MGALCRCHQRRAGAGASAEVSEPKVSRVWVLREPVRDTNEPLGEQADIEALVRRPLVDRFVV